MKRLINKIQRNSYFLVFIVVFTYVQSIDSRIRERTEMNAYTFTPDAAIGTLISVFILFLVLTFFINRWQKSGVFSTKEIVEIFASSLVSYLVFMQTFNLAIAFIFGNVERNFTSEIFILNTFMYLLDGFIYGSFFLAYNYYNKNKKSQDQLVKFNKAISESRISQLKTQLNPHFLFNNLNVLDQLIEEDKCVASDFLNQFAELYRFVLQTSDKKLIPIVEELAFAERYFKLIQYKYGDAYQLKIQSLNSNGFIVPLTLQLLIENAFKHNLGAKTRQVFINIVVNENIEVSNNCIPKLNMKPVSGKALDNLKEQYKLLARRPIEIQKSGNIFSVSIPIIDQQQE